jgi:hypothetical protein
MNKLLDPTFAADFLYEIHDQFDIFNSIRFFIGTRPHAYDSDVAIFNKFDIAAIIIMKPNIHT